MRTPYHAPICATVECAYRLATVPGDDVEKTLKRLQDITEDLIGSSSCPPGAVCGDLAASLWSDEQPQQLFQNNVSLDTLYWDGISKPDMSDGEVVLNTN